MECQSLFSEKIIRKVSSICCLLKFTREWQRLKHNSCGKLTNTKVYGTQKHNHTVNYYQNIPNGFSVMAKITFLHFLPQRLIIYKELWHLTSALASQYVSTCQKLSKYSKRFKSYSDFHKLIKGGRTRLGGAIYNEFLATDNFIGKILSICINMQ